MKPGYWEWEERTGELGDGQEGTGGLANLK